MLEFLFQKDFKKEIVLKEIIFIPKKYRLSGRYLYNLIYYDIFNNPYPSNLRFTELLKLFRRYRFFISGIERNKKGIYVNFNFDSSSELESFDSQYLIVDQIKDVSHR